MAGECTCAALRAAARRVTQSYDAALAPEGLTTAQYSLLSRLANWPAEPPAVQRLAEHLGLDRTTLAHNLRPLERDGLVTLRPDPADRRLRRVVITEGGRARRKACRPLWQQAQQRFVDRFGADRTALLMDALGAIAAAPADFTSEIPDAG